MCLPCPKRSRLCPGIMRLQAAERDPVKMAAYRQHLGVRGDCIQSLHRLHLVFCTFSTSFTIVILSRRHISPPRASYRKPSAPSMPSEPSAPPEPSVYIFTFCTFCAFCAFFTFFTFCAFCLYLLCLLHLPSEPSATSASSLLSVLSPPFVPSAPSLVVYGWHR